VYLVKIDGVNNITLINWLAKIGLGLRQAHVLKFEFP
jgi:hypothetical protein